MPRSSNVLALPTPIVASLPFLVSRIRAGEEEVLTGCMAAHWLVCRDHLQRWVHHPDVAPHCRRHDILIIRSSTSENWVILSSQDSTGKWWCTDIDAAYRKAHERIVTPIARAHAHVRALTTIAARPFTFTITSMGLLIDLEVVGFDLRSLGECWWHLAYWLNSPERSEIIQDTQIITVSSGSATWQVIACVDDGGVWRLLDSPTHVTRSEALVAMGMANYWHPDLDASADAENAAFAQLRREVEQDPNWLDRLPQS